jgi:hypothetical protein
MSVKFKLIKSNKLTTNRQLCIYIYTINFLICNLGIFQRLELFQTFQNYTDIIYEYLNKKLSKISENFHETMF